MMKMKMKYVAVVVFIMIVSLLYNRYKKKYIPDEELSSFPLVKKYLLDEDKKLSGKPILWIHTNYDVNARNWLDFESRNTKNLNQMYLEMCVESIVKFCSESFNICLINDDSFGNLIPGWTINVNGLANPIRSHMRDLALAKTLYYYGGFLLPNSMIVLKDLKELWYERIGKKNMFVGEMVARNVSSSKTRFFPSRKIIGCKKNSNEMHDYINKLEVLLSKDNTNKMDFSGASDRYLFDLINKGGCGLLSGKRFGIRTKCDKIVVVDDLMNATYIEFDKDLYGLYLPKEEILKRTKYNWFTRLSRQQVYNANTVVSKYFVISHGR